MKSLASVRDLFKPLESDLADAEKIVKSKLLAYQIEQEEAISKEQAKIEARVAKGTMRADTAAGKLETIGEVKKVKGVQARTLLKWRVTDITLVPREYLVPDESKIWSELKQGVSIPGTETYEEKSLAAV